MMPPSNHDYPRYGGTAMASNKHGDSMGVLILKEVESLAREKCFDREVVFVALEEAFQKVVGEKYGLSNDIRVRIDRALGHMDVSRCRRVVEEVVNPDREVHHADAPQFALGDIMMESLPLPQLTRVTVQGIKNALTKSLLLIERQMQYEEFKDRVGQIVSGVVKRIEGQNLILDIGRAEGVILRDELIPRENYRVNDRIKVYVVAVRQEPRGPQIFLSRTHPGFLAKLFAQEVPEIYDGVIEIKAVARDPGSRAKIAILAKEDRSFDPIGACVGVRGSRVNAVGQELQGEKIDIIRWSPEIAVFVVNAMTPAEVVKVILEKKKNVTVVVPDQQQSIAIGRKGQNVRLAHMLTGMNIEIITETLEAEQRSQKRQACAALFMEKLDLDELMAHFLVSEGFDSIQELAEASMEELASLEGFNDEIAQELKSRAEEATKEEENMLAQAFLDAGGAQTILDLGFPPRALSCLLGYRILTLRALADLSLGELREVLGRHGEQLNDEAWGTLILNARTLLGNDA
jgi:N utilization substance protein A